jgi:hypothetical protein
VEAPDWGLVGSSSSMLISTSLLQSSLSYEGNGGADCSLREAGGRARTEGLEGGGAVAGVAPKAEGVRLPTELDAVEDRSVKLDEMVDGGGAPRKR